MNVAILLKYVSDVGIVYDLFATIWAKDMFGLFHQSEMSTPSKLKTSSDEILFK